MNYWHLARVWYSTDTDEDDPEYQGAFSGTIPAAAFRDGAQIVNVDWSQKGWVEVTFLRPGTGHRHVDND